MAKTKKETEYKSQAIPSKISATSRVSVKVKDTYYTLEYTEERTLPTDSITSQLTGFDIEQERKLLWDTVNSEVDRQVEDVLKS